MRMFSHCLAFLVEAAALAAYLQWGWYQRASVTGSLLLALACAGLVVVLWAVLAAPQSPHRLAHSFVLLFKLAVFGGATLALTDIGQVSIAALFAATAALQLIIALSLGEL